MYVDIAGDVWCSSMALHFVPTLCYSLSRSEQMTRVDASRGVMEGADVLVLLLSWSFEHGQVRVRGWLLFFDLLHAA